MSDGSSDYEHFLEQKYMQFLEKNPEDFSKQVSSGSSKFILDYELLGSNPTPGAGNLGTSEELQDIATAFYRSSSQTTHCRAILHRCCERGCHFGSHIHPAIHILYRHTQPPASVMKEGRGNMLLTLFYIVQYSSIGSK